MAEQADTALAGNPRLFTSSWQSSIDEARFCRIGISRGTPRGQKGFRRYPRLNPGPWFRSIDDERAWAKRYCDEVLEPLDAARTVEQLFTLAAGRIPVLLCWEPPEPGEHCHRGLVAAWLKDELGLDVFELGFEQEGCGHRHPKLPRSLRRTG
jgi:hypothetical protein